VAENRSEIFPEPRARKLLMLERKTKSAEHGGGGENDGVDDVIDE